MLGDILNAWVHHWGWLWMLVGLCGFIIFTVASDN